MKYKFSLAWLAFFKEEQYFKLRNRGFFKPREHSLQRGFEPLNIGNKNDIVGQKTRILLRIGYNFNEILEHD